MEDPDVSDYRLLESGGLRSSEVATDLRALESYVVGISETWTGTDGTGWPAEWSLDYDTGSGSSTIQSNRGRLTESPVSGYQTRAMKLLTAVPTDLNVLVSFGATASVEMYPAIAYRANDAHNQGYWVEFQMLAGTNLVRLYDNVGGTVATSTAGAPSSTGRWWARTNVYGDRHQIRWWADGSSEPTTWGIDTTHTTTESTGFYLAQVSNVAASVDWDDLTIVPSTAPPAPTEFTDDFTYANGNLTTVGAAKWIAVSSYSSPLVVSNTAAGTGSGEFAAQWNATFAPNQYAQAQLLSGGGGAVPAVLTRCHAATGNLLRAGWNGSSAELVSHIGGTWSSVLAYTTVGTTPGVIRLESLGQAHHLYWNGVLVAAAVIEDSAVADGAPGIYFFWAPSADNYACGDLPAQTFPKSDDFNRANASELGALWTPGYSIVSNTARRTGAEYTRYMVDLETPDHWIEADIGFGWDTHFYVLNARGSGGVGQNGYLGWLDPNVAFGYQAKLGKVVSGGFTGLAGNLNGNAGSSTAGFKARLEVEGSTVRYYRNGTLLEQQTDTSLPTGNFVGFNTDDTGSALSYYDNFRCGPLPYTAP